MEHFEDHFSGFDEKKLYYQVWKNPAQNKGTVIIIHGFAEHSGRHSNVATALAETGFSVYAMDNRGCGRSEGKRNYIKKFTDYFKDFKIFEELVKNKESGPFHLFGHSLGSVIACNYIIYNPDTQFNSLVLTGTGAAPGPDINSFLILLTKIFGKILPNLYVASKFDPSSISHDQQVVEAYINDPLVSYKKIPARYGSEALKYTLRMYDSAKNVNIPVFIGIGEEDGAFHPNSREPLFNSFPNQDKKLKIYENMKHEICNEINKEVPINDIKDWILAHS